MASKTNPIQITHTHTHTHTHIHTHIYIARFPDPNYGVKMVNFIINSPHLL